MKKQTEIPIEALLCLNTGSSSIKFSIYAITPDKQLDGLRYHGLAELKDHAIQLTVQDTNGNILTKHTTPSKQHNEHEQLLCIALDWLKQHDNGINILAVGHRVVHGGERFSAAERVNPTMLAFLETLTPLAPLHQPHNLAGIRAMTAIWPTLSQVACFDTAFHSTQANIAQQFALPRELTEKGIRRYGFHGLSYDYIASVLPDYLGQDAEGRVIVAHLGNGASLCALQQRKSIASTMGLTALDGLMMGTRCGNLDPGVILYLLNEHKMDVPTLTDLLYQRSGLLGVSGISSDMRTLLASSNPHAQEAIELFCYRISRELGSLAAALGGVDALVFTGGIGENALPIRQRVCEMASWLGITPNNTWVIPTNEEYVIARDTLNLTPYT